MIDRLTVKYHEEVVGILSLTPDNKLCALELSFHAMIPSFHAVFSLRQCSLTEKVDYFESYL